MKKIIFLLLAILPFVAFGQKAKIEFEATSHDFGTISESGGPAVYEFVFKNTGDGPLILTNVRTSCGCTTPFWSREPIAPGGKGSVKVSFDPRNRPNNFFKNVTVNSNASNPVVSLTIKGTVTKKPADPYAAYHYSLGKLKAGSPSLNLGNIFNDAVVEKSIDIVNTGDQPLTLTVKSENSHITSSVTPATLTKGQKGKIYIKYNAAGKNDWGFVTDKIYLTLNDGSKGEISIAANIREDFSKVKPEEAPVAEFSEREVQLGNLAKNSVKKHEFYIQNTGKSPLIIRKITTSDNSVTASPSRTTIKPGKKAKISLALKTDDQAGTKKKIVSFTFNDPKNTLVSYKLTGNVQ